MTTASQPYWRGPYTFQGGEDTQRLSTWGCRGQAGIYVIRDQQDLITQYVGKGEGGATGCDIYTRLKNHLSGEGNKGIQHLVRGGETFQIRWLPSTNPSLSESILVNLLQPRCNKQPTWVGRERAQIGQIVAEVKRLNIGSFEHRNFGDILAEAKQLNLRTAQYTVLSQEFLMTNNWYCSHSFKQQFQRAIQ
jgi:hypothetical protein